MEYVVIDFSGVRGVLIDDVVQGNNRDETGKLRIFRVGAGLHAFALAGPDDYEPPFQEVDVQNTTSIAPLRVAFTAKPRSGREP